MSQFKVTKGSEFKLQWPSTPNVVSESSIEEIQKQLSSNPLVSLTEKIDGSCICLSSTGWIASRRQIICDDIERADFKKLKHQGVSLIHLKCVWSLISEAKNEIKENFGFKDFELLLYGELVLKGTATSIADHFRYKSRGIITGHLHSFGLAFNFEQDLSEEEEKIFREKTRDLVGDVSIRTKQPSKFFITLYNRKLDSFLRGRQIRTVPYVGEDQLRKIFLEESLKRKLTEKEVEGFVITAPNFIAKWKIWDFGDKSSQKSAISLLRAQNLGFDVDEVISSLEEVCLDTGVSKRDLVKLNTKLFIQLIKSAISKHPSLTDSLDSLGDEWRDGIAEINKNYLETLTDEISKDLIELGYQLNSDLLKEVNGRLETFVNDLIKDYITRRIEEEVKSQFDVAWKFLRN